MAKEFNLAPKGNLQQAQADSLAHVVNELETTLTEAYGEKDPERKEKGMKTATEEVIPDKCGYFEKILSANKNGFFIGEKVGRQVWPEGRPSIY